MRHGVKWRCATRGGNGGRAGCKAAHRAIGAAARWGHRALPRRDRTANGPRNGTRMVRRGRKWRCVTRVRNGGRVQRCGGAGATGRARARDAKPRTAPCGAAARWGHRALPQRDTATGPNGKWIVRRDTGGAHGTQRDRMANGSRDGTGAVRTGRDGTVWQMDRAMGRGAGAAGG